VFADRQARAKVAKQLADEGMSTREIATLTGVGKDTIRRDLAGANAPNSGANAPTKAERRAERELELATKDTPNNNCYDFGDYLGMIV
jgi:transposase